jgi:anti-sigma regulatory factor (Ser/Thr protein kinase)
MTIQLTSDPKWLCVLRAAVEAAGLSVGFSQDECDRIVLALDEAVCNMIRHGYQGRTDGPIWLTLRRTSDNGRDGIQIILEDACGDVELDRIKSRNLEDIRPGGLGVHIIHQIMDDVEYSKRENGAGLRLRMSKFLAPAQPARKTG